VKSEEREWLDDLDSLLAELVQSSGKRHELSEGEREATAARLEDVFQRMFRELFPSSQERTVVLLLESQSQVLRSVAHLLEGIRRSPVIDAALVQRAQEAVAHRRDEG